MIARERRMNQSGLQEVQPVSPNERVRKYSNALLIFLPHVYAWSVISSCDVSDDTRLRLRRVENAIVSETIISLRRVLRKASRYLWRWGGLSIKFLFGI
jgi:hypothetical protein